MIQLSPNRRIENAVSLAPHVSVYVWADRNDVECVCHRIRTHWAQLPARLRHLVEKVQQAHHECGSAGSLPKIVVRNVRQIPLHFSTNRAVQESGFGAVISGIGKAYIGIPADSPPADVTVKGKRVYVVKSVVKSEYIDRQTFRSRYVDAT